MTEFDPVTGLMISLQNYTFSHYNVFIEFFFI